MAWRNFQAKIWKRSKNVTCKISPYRRSRTGLKISLDLRLSSTSLKTGEFMLLLLWVNLRLLIFKKDSFGLVPTAIRKFLSISCRIEVLSFYNKMIMTMQVCRLKEAWTILTSIRMKKMRNWIWMRMVSNLKKNKYVKMTRILCCF